MLYHGYWKAMDMAPLLNEGSDGMEALKIKAGELGLVMGVMILQRVQSLMI